MKSIPAAFLKLSRRGKIIVITGLALAAFGGVFSIKTYDFVQHDARFCQSCHIMEGAFEKWSTSPHHLVTCHECHQQSMKASLHQLWMYTTQRPEKVEHHPSLDHKTCAKCHLSEDTQWKLVGETAGHKQHFEKLGIDCLDCHMGGVHKFLRPVDVCVNCHPDKSEGPGEKMAFVHCTECHAFLAEKDDLAPTKAACLRCHEKIKVGHETFSSTGKMSSFECGTCHKPHGKIRPNRETCLACHAEIQVPHYQMSKNESCVKCHKPHSWKTQ